MSTKELSVTELLDDDIFCQKLYDDYLNNTDPDKDETVSLNKLAAELGIEAADCFLTSSL